jgi:hypothetical protein
MNLSPIEKPLKIDGRRVGEYAVDHDRGGEAVFCWYQEPLDGVLYASQTMVEQIEPYVATVYAVEGEDVYVFDYSEIDPLYGDVHIVNRFEPPFYGSVDDNQFAVDTEDCTLLDRAEVWPRGVNDYQTHHLSE